MNFFDRFKKNTWEMIYPLFMPVQRFFIKIGIARHDKGRQPYHIGWLSPSKTLEDLKAHLHGEWGFGNHFIAWTDENQVLSWRKLIDFNNQYHLRVFKDGEIRGHLEYTPEGHPLDHFIEKGEKDAKTDFLKFLGKFVVDKKYISHLEIDPNAYDPTSEVTIDKINT